MKVNNPGFLLTEWISHGKQSHCIGTIVRDTVTALRGDRWSCPPSRHSATRRDVESLCNTVSTTLQSKHMFKKSWIEASIIFWRDYNFHLVVFCCACTKTELMKLVFRCGHYIQVSNILKLLFLSPGKMLLRCFEIFQILRASFPISNKLLKSQIAPYVERMLCKCLLYLSKSSVGFSFSLFFVHLGSLGAGQT